MAPSSESSSTDTIFESALEKSSQVGKEAVLNLLKSLGDGVVYSDSGNFETNKKLWNQYAQDWDPDKEWVKEMVSHLPAEEKNAVGRVIGDEWSTHKDLQEIMQRFVQPYLNADAVVAEIGSGGGRVAKQICGDVKSLCCLDVSDKMLQKLQNVMEAQGATNMSYVHLRSTNFPTEKTAPHVQADHFDFIYCFDVLVHCDLHVIFKYLQNMYACLKVGGKAFISTADVTSPGGWDRFSKQSKATVGGFCFLSPDILHHLISKTGFRIVKEGKEELSSFPDNVYLTRDYLVVLEKEERTSQPSTTGV